jgi:DNA (cytosine-5)-methyltransferase 1
VGNAQDPGCGARRDPWRECEWVWHADGKWRPVEPGTFPLADGLPGRVGRLRGYGNAIVPQVAAAFVKAALEAIAEIE